MSEYSYFEHFAAFQRVTYLLVCMSDVCAGLPGRVRRIDFVASLPQCLARVFKLRAKLAMLAVNHAFVRESTSTWVFLIVFFCPMLGSGLGLQPYMRDFDFGLCRADAYMQHKLLT